MAEQTARRAECYYTIVVPQSGVGRERANSKRSKLFLLKGSQGLSLLSCIRIAGRLPLVREGVRTVFISPLPSSFARASQTPDWKSRRTSVAGSTLAPSPTGVLTSVGPSETQQLFPIERGGGGAAADPSGLSFFLFSQGSFSLSLTLASPLPGFFAVRSRPPRLQPPSDATQRGLVLVFQARKHRLAEEEAAVGGSSTFLLGEVSTEWNACWVSRKGGDNMDTMLDRRTHVNCRLRTYT